MAEGRYIIQVSTDLIKVLCSRYTGKLTRPRKLKTGEVRSLRAFLEKKMPSRTNAAPRWSQYLRISVLSAVKLCMMVAIVCDQRVFWAESCGNPAMNMPQIIMMAGMGAGRTEVAASL